MAEEYVSKQYLLDEYDRQHHGPPGGARKIIEDAPAADVVPVVFCKDCRKRRKDGYCTKFIQNISGIASAWYMPRDDDFCSYGERE